MKHKQKKIFLIILVTLFILGIIIFIFQRGSNNPATMENKITVVTSFYPLYFLTSEIGGDLIEVVNLTPAGVEPHDYDLTSRDMIKIIKSELIVLNGAGLETWISKVKENIILSGVRVLVLSDELNDQKIGNDPHIWLSPVLAAEMGEKIATELIKIDPQNKDYYQSNLTALKTELLNLDSRYKSELENCRRRDFITSHKAFDYMAGEYNLNQVAIAGLSPEEEPSPRRLGEISQLARENEIKYIFFENLVSPKLSQVIANEIGAQTLVLNPIEGLSADDMKKGKNYITEMEANLENLKIALECGDN